MESNGWIQTHTGKRVDPFNATPELIDIKDIAHSLSLICRYNGHCKTFYSVAQHSVYVSEICKKENSLWGLLHDATEAYICDIPRPLKRSKQFEFYIDVEDKLMAVIGKHFGLPEGSMPADVKAADTDLLFNEKRDLLTVDLDWGYDTSPNRIVKIEPLSSKEAEKQFLRTFEKLTS